MEEVDYPGHTLSHQGVAMQVGYVARVGEWPVPTNLKELNTLLGFLGYYKRFISEFALLTAEMNSQKTVLNGRMSEKLRQLKEKFAAAPT